MRKTILKMMEVLLGLAPKEEMPQQLHIDPKLSSMLDMIKPAPYEMKLAFMKFAENAVNLAEKEHGLNFTPQQFQEAIIKLLNGNPLNMLSLLSSNFVLKN